MTEKNRQKNLRQKKTWPIPVLPLRILIYCLLILFAVLALFQVATSKFHTVFGVIFYVLAAVFMALTAYCLIWDVRNLRRNVNGIVIPGIQKNRFANKVTHDSSYRFWISTEIALALNLVFGIFNGVIGLMSHSAWCVTMAFYYMILGGMQFGAVRYHHYILKKKYDSVEKTVLKEISIYRICSILLVLMAVVLGGAVILLVRAEGGKQYPGFTIYAFALYTFIKSGLAIKDRIKASKQNSAFLIAVRNIGYADAFVSILTLQTAMFAAFGDMSDFLSRMMNGITGSVVCLIVLSTGIAGIIFSEKMKREVKKSLRKDS